MKLNYFQNFYKSWKPLWLYFFFLICRFWNLVLMWDFFFSSLFRMQMFLLVSTWKWNKNSVPRGNIWETPLVALNKFYDVWSLPSNFWKFGLCNLAAFSGLIKGLGSLDLFPAGPHMGTARGNPCPALMPKLLWGRQTTSWRSTMPTWPAKLSIFFH